MRIALYHPWIYLKGGVERTILELTSRSRHDWTIFTGRYARDDTFPEFRQLPVVELGALSVKRNVANVAMACLRLLTTRPDWSDYDAIVISCEGVGNLMTFHARGRPLFCLCHTPLKVAYDPWTRGRWLSIGRPGLLTRAGVRIFTWVDRLTWHRYQRVFCVSYEVERRLVGAGLVRPGQTEIAHPGVDVERLRPSGRREPFFLLPGRIMWSKNLELGIRAFAELKSRAADPRIADLRLVIAGMVDAKSQPYYADLRRLAAGRDDIDFVTDPSDATLFDLYDRCFGVLFTPLNEDWGIVPLEAMAHGKPVIAVDRGGPAESIVHKETGLLCLAEPWEFAGAMDRLLSDERLYAAMSEAARDRALRYRWESFVTLIDDTIEHHAIARAAVPERVPGWEERAEHADRI